MALIILGKCQEQKIKTKASNLIKDMLQNIPTAASIVKGNNIVCKDLKDIQVGDIVVAREGEKIPVDGFISDGASYVDESMLTGESVANYKQKGSNVFAASINQSSTIYISVTTTNNSMFAQITKLTEQAINSKAHISNIADKISNIFVPVIFTISTVAAAIVW